MIKDSISHTINQPKEHQQEQIQPIQKNKGRCFSCRSKVIKNNKNKNPVGSSNDYADSTF